MAPRRGIRSPEAGQMTRAAVSHLCHLRKTAARNVCMNARPSADGRCRTMRSPERAPERPAAAAQHAVHGPAAQSARSSLPSSIPTRAESQISAARQAQLDPQPSGTTHAAAQLGLRHSGASQDTGRPALEASWRITASHSQQQHRHRSGAPADDSTWRIPAAPPESPQQHGLASQQDADVTPAADGSDWRIPSAVQPSQPLHDDNEDSMSVHERGQDSSMLIPARHLSFFRCALHAAVLPFVLSHEPECEGGFPP